MFSHEYERYGDEEAYVREDFGGTEWEEVEIIDILIENDGWQEEWYFRRPDGTPEGGCGGMQEPPCLGEYIPEEHRDVPPW